MYIYIYNTGVCDKEQPSGEEYLWENKLCPPYTAVEEMHAHCKESAPDWNEMKLQSSTLGGTSWVERRKDSSSLLVTHPVSGGALFCTPPLLLEPLRLSKGLRASTQVPRRKHEKVLGRSSSSLRQLTKQDTNQH